MSKVLRFSALALGLGLALGLTACGGKPPAPIKAHTAVQERANPHTPSATAQPKPTATPPSRSATTVKSWSSPPPMTIDPNKNYTATFNTNLGTFTVRLFAKDAPQTVNNFVFLVNQGFYNGDHFFRVVKPFMIQTGDPTNLGTGGPGYNIPDELPVKHPYAPGIVAMANTGQPNSGGSQFFICTGSESSVLNQEPNYTQFGQVVSGMDVVEKIAAVPVTANPYGPPGPNGEPELSRPTQPVYINTITIQES